MFASRKFGEKSVAGSYYDLLAYTDFGRKQRSRTKYGEGYMQTTAQSFWKWAAEVEGKVFDSRGREYSFWVAPSLHWATQYTISLSYMEGDSEGTGG